MRPSILLIGVFFFMLYSLTAVFQPTGYADADEFMTVSATGGVAHPPGFPLQTLLYRIGYITAPFVSSAARSTWITIFCAAATVTLLSAVLHAIKPKAAMFGAGVFGLSFFWWLYSGITDIPTLTGLLSVSTLLAVVIYIKSNEQESRWLGLAFALFGLLVNHYPLAILLAPGLLYIFISTSKQAITHKLLSLLIGLGISLLMYGVSAGILLIFNSTSAEISWNFPASINGLINHLTIKEYLNQELPAASQKNYMLESIFLYGKFLAEHFSWLGFGLGILGIIQTARKRDRLMMGVLVMWVFSGLLLAGVMQLNQEVFLWMQIVGIGQRQFVLSELLFAIFIWHAAVGLPKRWDSITLGVLCLWLLVTNSTLLFDKEGRTTTSAVYSSFLNSVKPNALIICSHDISCYSLWHKTAAEHQRSDVTVISVTPTYRKNFLLNHKDIYPFPLYETEDFIPQLIAWNLEKRPVYITESMPKLTEYAGLESGPFYLQPAGWGFEVIKTRPINWQFDSQFTELADRKHLIPSKDYFGRSIFFYLSNIQSYAGYLALRYNQPEAAKQYLETAKKFDTSNIQTQTLIDQLGSNQSKMATPSAAAAPAELLKAGDKALRENDPLTAESYFRSVFYMEPTNRTAITKLINVYTLLNENIRRQTFVEYLAYLETQTDK